MKIISSELYVKDNKVYHEGNKPKPKDIGAAPETHTHNYASATTPGGSAEHAIKATEDSLGQRIDKYIKGLSVSGRTITYTRGDGTTGTITTQDNDTDTKVTNTLNTTAKAYITGTTNSATNTGTQVFDTNVYLDTTAGMLTATTFKGALQGNAATATSATKLATVRTINGTSFDGTANITTANWGTARNIRIGNAVKSVNGSGNVSWSLSEIGAATMYNIPNSGASKNYSRICTMPANIGDGQGGLSAIIMGASDYGGTEIPLIKLSFSTRGYSGSGTIPSNVVNAVAIGQGRHIEDLSFITKLVNNTVELWMSASPYPYPIKMIVFNNSQITMNCDSNTTTAPTGTITTHTIAKAYTSAHKPTPSDIGASRAHSASHSFGENDNAITTAQFITMLTNLGAFSQPHWVSRGSWSYAGNQYINDTGCGNIHLAGCVVEVFGNTSAYTIKVTTPTTSSSGVTNGDFIYVNNGNGYSPGWRRLYNTAYKPTASEIGAAAASHTHNYAGSSSAGGAANSANLLNITGGRPTSANTSVIVGPNTAMMLSTSAMTTGKPAGDGYITEYRWDNNAGWNAQLFVPNNTTGVIQYRSMNAGTWGNWNTVYSTCNPQTTITGNAGTATKLQTARTIALGGILSGSASFDGSGNVTINATANDITTIKKSLNVTTSWMDTGITGSNLATGTYAVQMHINEGANTGQYNEYYSGIMSWYADSTNSTDADEILLHKAGHAPNGGHLYLRTIRTGNHERLKLQISCTHAFSAASNITFKFKKLI